MANALLPDETRRNAAAGEASDWQALDAFLRMSFQADYRRASNTSVEVNQTVQTAVVCDEETRMKLIAQRERILKGQAEPKGDCKLKAP